MFTEGEKEDGKIQADREVSPCAGEGQVGVLSGQLGLPLLLAARPQHVHRR